MKHTAVVLADASRARFFELGQHRGQGGQTEPRLVELCDLIQPGRRARQAEKLANTRPGIRRAAGGATGHAVDDRRDAKADEGDRRFAGEVVAAVGQLCDDNRFAHLVVVAPPRFAGHLRERDVETACQDVAIVTLDLSGLAPAQALDHLQRGKHLPG